jgi:LmbE family N-acetylglucosaminyl deacetylase
MIAPLHLEPSDRILYLAPHPDDEALGGGGLIQRAVAAGAALEVVFLTDGDRNPWPQRVLERRLFIGDEERRRWGARRRAEALSALEVLGCARAGHTRFLGWPDQGLTALLTSANGTAVETLASLIAGTRPTLLVFPTADDTHPDHSALFVLVQLALEKVRHLAPPPRQLCYLVHRPRQCSLPAAALLALSNVERLNKRRAIERHETQMLSRRRFVAHAQPEEIFFAPSSWPAPAGSHPVGRCGLSRGALRLSFTLPAGCRSFRGATLRFVAETVLDESLRWSLRLPHTSQVAELIDDRTGSRRTAVVRIDGRAATVSLPMANAATLARLFVKFAKRTVFFDLAGWREVPVRALGENCPPTPSRRELPAPVPPRVKILVSAEPRRV